MGKEYNTLTYYVNWIFALKSQVPSVILIAER